MSTCELAVFSSRRLKVCSEYREMGSLRAGSDVQPVWRGRAGAGLASVCLLCPQMGRRPAESDGHVEPSLVTYNTVISACAKAGMWPEARSLADDMADAGIAPDVFTLCALVRQPLLRRRL